MNEVILNGLPWDKISGRTVNNARFYLKNKRLAPPEGYSHERLAFFACALEPLLQLFFAAQHFEGEYSAWVQRSLAALPPLKDLRTPNAEEQKIFAGTVADEPKINAFLRGEAPDLPTEGYVALAPYRAERARLKALEKTAYAGQRGRHLAGALKAHELRFPAGGEEAFWAEMLKVGGRLGEDLREAFLDGGYPLLFDDHEFKKFVFGLSGCPGLNAGQLAKIYRWVYLRSLIFSSDADARQLADVFAGPLRDYAVDYSSRPRNIDLISLFSLEDPARIKKLSRTMADDLEAGWRDFFYIADYGQASERDFAGFDEKLDLCVAFLNSQYQKTGLASDLWEDPYFKFLYMMCALWFKSCYSKQHPGGGA